MNKNKNEISIQKKEYTKLKSDLNYYRIMLLITTVVSMITVSALIIGEK